MQILIETLFFGQSVPGYPSVVVGLMVLGGVQLIMIGIMGEYIGKILSELKAAAGLFRVRAQPEDRRRKPAGDRRTAAGGGMSRRIWLCADDYGIAPGVNAAIRDLIARGRLNATSVMVVAPALPEEAAALAQLNDDKPSRRDRPASHADSAVPAADAGV